MKIIVIAIVVSLLMINVALVRAQNTTILESPTLFNRQASGVINMACSSALDNADFKFDDKKYVRLEENLLKYCDNDMLYLKGICEKTNNVKYNYCDKSTLEYKELYHYLFERGLLTQPRPDSPVSRALGG